MALGCLRHHRVSQPAGALPHLTTSISAGRAVVSRHRAWPLVPTAPTRAAAAATQAAAPPLDLHHNDAQLLSLPDQLEEQQAPVPTWEPPVDRPGLYDGEGRLVLKALTLPELEAWCASVGEAAPANRALQLWRWMYADPPASSSSSGAGGGGWVRSLEETTGRQNGFSAKFLEKVSSHVSLSGGLRLSQVVRAADGTRKLVFSLEGGQAAGGSIETVLIPVVRQAGLRDRLTICVSSQVGCAMNCQFCYTGRMGLLGNLTTAQIVEQVVEARRFLAAEGDRTPLTNLVFMGMGEPLHNTEAVLAAADIVSHYLGLHISHNKITISTVGLVPEMRAVMARTRVQMALSLHATTDEVRDWIVPVNRRYDLATLTTALEELFPKEQEGEEEGNEAPRAAASTSNSSSVEFDAAVAGLQGQPQEHADRGAAQPSTSSEAVGRWLPAVERFTGEQPAGEAETPSTSAKTSSGSSDGSSSSSSSSLGGSSSSSSYGNNAGRSLLIEYVMLHGINDTLEDAIRLSSMLSRVNAKVNLICFNPHKGTRFWPSTDGDITAFRSALIQRGLVCTIRDSRGDDEMAACGQLGDVGLSFRPSPILDAPERFRKFLTPLPAVPAVRLAAIGAGGTVGVIAAAAKGEAAAAAAVSPARS